MNKHLKTYLLSVSTLLICSCAKNDMLVESSPEAGRQNIPICFAGSNVDNAATRHANRLCDHSSTMGVWGWYTDTKKNTTRAFNDQAVTYNPDSTRWEYNPLQYWHEGSQYYFCAYAPHQGKNDARVSIDSTTHMISIKGVTLHGHNLQCLPTDSVQELFRNTPDTDWMVARAGQTATGKAGMDIEFMMQHILAKLNIRIKECEELAIRPYLSGITADSIIVGNLPAHGDFAQQLTHTPITSDPTEADIQEWAASDTTLFIKGTHACGVTVNPTYMVESLVIPHHIGPTSTLTLYYSYHFKDGHTEQCRYRMPLTEAFSRFVSGYNYTLTLIVCSAHIEFEAGASDWVREQ